MENTIRETAIEKALKEQQNELVLLKEKIDNLADRFSSVMRDESSVLYPQEDKPEKTSTVALAISITDATDRIQIERQRIESIIDRCEL